jgi:hypothetical protein
MECKECKETYGSGFDEDFVNGVCLPCRAQKEHDEYVLKEAKELERFNKKNRTDYDDNSFYYACDAGEIVFSQLKGFPKLKDVWNYSDRRKKEIAYYDELRKNKQLEMFDNMNGEDLPF